MKKLVMMITAIIMYIMLTSCTQNAETEIKISNVNPNKAMYVIGDTIFYDDYGYETHSLICLEPEKEPEVIDTGMIFPSMCSDGKYLYYSKYTSSDNVDIVRCRMNDFADKETLFSISNGGLFHFEKEYLHEQDGHVYYQSASGELWDYHNGKAELKLDNLECSAIYGDTVYYVESGRGKDVLADSIVYADDLSFSNKRKVVSKYDVFDDEECSKILHWYGENFGYIENIAIHDDYVYILLTPNGYGYLFRAKIDGTGLESVGIKENEWLQVRYFQICGNKLYAIARLRGEVETGSGLFEVGIRNNEVKELKKKAYDFYIADGKIYFSTRKDIFDIKFNLYSMDINGENVQTILE